jgi:cyclohexa-1,5-dienecarbonyl-CoA hydratase
MSYETIDIRECHDGAVCEIVLNTPPANILTAKMMAEIDAQLTLEIANTARKLIVFSGEGKHFSFGASVEEHTADKVGDMLPAFHSLMGNILAHPVPTMARVSGQCLGGGFELALVCSFIMADEGAKFAVPEIQLGVFPPVAALLIPRIAGSLLAADMVLTGSAKTATELKQAGLVTKLSTKGELDSDIEAFIEKQILPKSASSLRFAHSATRMDLSTFYNENIGALEALYLNELMSSTDANEGIGAFIEKRQVEWKNA